MRRLLIPLVFALLLCSVPLGATTYYLRADGTATKSAATSCSSASTAMSVTTHNSSTFSPGDAVVMCDTGGVFRTTLVPPSSGSSGNPITYSNSGSPILSADNLTTWTQGTGYPSQETCTGACEFVSNFQNSSFTDWTSHANTDTNFAQSTTNPFNGSYDAALGPGVAAGNRANVQKTISAFVINTTYYFRFYIYIPSGAMIASQSIKAMEVGLNSGAVNLQLSLIANGSGNIATASWYDSTHSFGLSGVAVSNFVMGAWNYIDASYTVSATVGGMQMWVNGISIGSVTGQNSATAVGWNNLLIGNANYASLLTVGDYVYFSNVQVSTAGPIGALSGVPTTVWYASQTTNPYLINFSANAACTSTPSSCLGIPVSSIGSVVSPNDWYWDGSTYVYVYGPGNPASTVEIPARNNSATITGQDYLTFQDITFRGGLSHSVYLTGQTSNDYFNNDIFELSYYDGWYLLENTATLTNEQLTNSIFRYNGASGMQVNASYWTNFLISGNQSYYNAQAPSSETNHNFAAGLHAYCGVTSGGSGSVFSNNLVYDNGVGAVPTPTLAGEGNGIHIDTCTGISVTHNYLQDNFQNDILLEKDYNSSASYNVIYSTITHFNYTGAVGIEAMSGFPAVNNTVVGNSLYGTFWWGLQQNVEDTSTTTVTGNVWRNNIVIMTGSSPNALYVDSYSYNSGANGNLWDHNALGVAATCFAVFPGTCRATYAALDSAYGSAMNNVQTDPKYTNPTAGILTLQSTSPAIAAGIPVAGYGVGLLPAANWPSNVVLQQQAPAWNMGAYVTSGGNAFWFTN